MPFTISHTAAVLPFAHFLRRWRLLSAAIIGSMIPDFDVLLPVQLQRYDTHGLPALFTFCLPFGLLWYWLFQLHIKPATYELMPDRLHEYWRVDARPARLRQLRQWLYAAIGVLLGAVTHLMWDSFTHENARGVRMLSVFDGLGLTVAGYSLTWYRSLQHVSSVVGLLFVVWFIWRDVHRATARAAAPARRFTARERRRWFATYACVALAPVIGSVALLLYATYPHFAAIEVLRRAAVASLWGLVASLLGVSALVRLRVSRLVSRSEYSA